MLANVVIFLALIAIASLFVWLARRALRLRNPVARWGLDEFVYRSSIPLNHCRLVRAAWRPVARVAGGRLPWPCGGVSTVRKPSYPAARSAVNVRSQSTSPNPQQTCEFTAPS